MQCHFCALTHDGEENECGGRTQLESELYWLAFNRRDSYLMQLVGDMVRARVTAKLAFIKQGLKAKDSFDRRPVEGL